MKTFRIGNLEIGTGRCFIVMEIAQAHDGSLGMAHAFIDIAMRARVDAIKFQTHIAAAESTSREPFRVQFSLQDATRFDYWKRMEFTPDQWAGLARHAQEKGLVFLSTPYSFEAVELLQKLDIPAWKIGSGEIGNFPLLERMIATGKPLLLSSGMCSWQELDDAVELVGARVPILIYQCTTKYPCPAKEVGLPLLGTLRKRYDVPVGLSDHSGLPCFSIAAAALGAASVEVHLALSRDAFGPDVPASITPVELANMVEDIRAVEKSLRSVPNKDALCESLAEGRRIFGRSIVAARAIACREVLTEDNLALKKPGGGIPPGGLNRLIGKKARRALSPDELVTLDDVGE